MKYDIIAFIGLVALCAGVVFSAGWEIALIVSGLFLIVIGVLGALNDTEEITESSENDTT